jgi:hypothetical protein
MDLFAGLKAPLEDIKELAGSPPGSLAMLQRSASRIATLIAAVVPPEEVTAAHALLLSAVQLAGNAAQIRREAALAGDMARAWDASSAAAGALMLGAKARTTFSPRFACPISAARDHSSPDAAAPCPEPARLPADDPGVAIRPSRTSGRLACRRAQSQIPIRNRRGSLEWRSAAAEALERRPRTVRDARRAVRPASSAPREVLHGG